MAQLLIRTIDDFQAFFPLTYTESSMKRLWPFIEEAQEQYLLPVLGEVLYADLLDYADADNADSGLGSGSGSGGSFDEPTDLWLSRLLRYARKPVAILAVFEGFDQLEIHIGAQGITQIGNSDERQPIFSGQRVNAKRALLRQGMNSVERMLVWLEKYKTNFEYWAQSDERTDMLGHILPTATAFTKEWAKLDNKRLTYMALRAHMLQVEQEIVRPMLGGSLTDEILGQLRDGSVTAINEKLLKYLRPMVAKYTAARAMPGLAVHVEAFGLYSILTEKNEKNTEVWGMADKVRFEQERKQLIDDAKERHDALDEYLQANVDTYPDYAASGDYEEEPETDADRNDAQDDFGIVGF